MIYYDHMVRWWSGQHTWFSSKHSGVRTPYGLPFFYVNKKRKQSFLFKNVCLYKKNGWGNWIRTSEMADSESAALPLCLIWLRVQDYHLLWCNFPDTSTHHFSTMSRSYNPSHALRRHWFGLFPVRSPLLGESFIYFLFLQVLRCFSSLR